MNLGIVLISCIVVAALGFLIFRFCVALAANSISAREKKTIALELSDVGSQHPVFYASQLKFASLFSKLPWEAAGVLVSRAENYEFHVDSARGPQLLIRIPKQESKIHYLQRGFLRDGGLSWLEIELYGEKHYFTAGKVLPRLEQSSSPQLSTTGVYEALSDTFIRMPRRQAGE